MKKVILVLTILIIVVSCNQKLAVNPGTSNEDSYGTLSNGDTIPGQYILIMSPGFDTALIQQLKYQVSDTGRIGPQADQSERGRKEANLKKFLEDNGLKYKDIFVDVTIGAVVNMDTTKAKALQKNKDVEAVIPDVVTQTNPIQQTDPDVNTNPIQQWMSPPIPDTNPIQQNDSIQKRYDIDTVKHWTKALVAAGGPVSGAGKSTVIWFLDTGIDPSPYLNVDRSLGKSFYGASTEDDYGHGTLCAGVAAGKPIAGSPGHAEIHYGVSEGATVVPVKVLDANRKGTWGIVIAGLNHVAQNRRRGDILNLSLGAYDAQNTTCPFPPSLTRPIVNIAASGVYVTLSAGNDAGNAAYNCPGCTNATNVFTVSSINGDGTCAPYANFGLPPVDFVTVGTRVFSLWDNGNFIMATGTSISSAILAGIIHARNGAPASNGTRACMGGNYPIGVR